MSSRWYNIAVVALWLSTTTWLVTQKIAPSLLLGEPPSRTRILAAQRQEPAVAWRLSWDDEELGWALHTTEALDWGGTRVYSRIHFDRLPLKRIIPGLVHSVLSPDSPLPPTVPLEAHSSVLFDADGRLSRFASSLRFFPEVDAVALRGTVREGQLTVSVRSGNFTYELTRPLPRKALLGDALSPQTRLPGLRRGQRWTVELYSPLRPPNDPVEILIAEVERREPIVWADRTVNTWLVVYRDDPGTTLGDQTDPRAWIWVRPDGTVLQQRVRVFGSAITFVRLPPEEAAGLARKFDRHSIVFAEEPP